MVAQHPTFQGAVLAPFDAGGLTSRMLSRFSARRNFLRSRGQSSQRLLQVGHGSKGFRNISPRRPVQPWLPDTRDLRRAKEAWPHSGVVGDCGDQSFSSVCDHVTEEQLTNLHHDVEEVRESIRALNTNIFNDCPGILRNGVTQMFGIAARKNVLQHKVAGVNLPSSGITYFHREGVWAIPPPFFLMTEPRATRNPRSQHVLMQMLADPCCGDPSHDNGDGCVVDLNARFLSTQKCCPLVTRMSQTASSTREAETWRRSTGDPRKSAG